jgi:hypothetical protein
VGLNPLVGRGSAADQLVAVAPDVVAVADSWSEPLEDGGAVAVLAVT